MSIKAIINAAKSLLKALEQMDNDGVIYYDYEEAKYLHHLIEEYEKRSIKVHKELPKPRYN